MHIHSVIFKASIEVRNDIWNSKSWGVTHRRTAPSQITSCGNTTVIKCLFRHAFKKINHNNRHVRLYSRLRQKKTNKNDLRPLCNSQTNGTVTSGLFAGIVILQIKIKRKKKMARPCKCGH